MEWMNYFQNPPAEFRPAPIWAWNAEITKEQMERQLKEMADHGFGGAFTVAGIGTSTSYLTEEWFELWGYALEKAKELGLKLYIYDENGWPSGLAGGHTVAACPEAIVALASYFVTDDPNQVKDGYLAAYAAEEVNGKFVHCVNLEGIPKKDWKNYGSKFLVVTEESGVSNPRCAGFGFPDVLRPQLPKKFMELTHEQYYKRFGQDFGEHIPAIFTDEPSVDFTVRGEGFRVYFNHWFAYEFQKRNGYDLIRNMLTLFMDVEGDCFDHPSTKVRFDYYNTIYELWIQNSIEPTSKWCKEHGIKWTGHYLEHEWPTVFYNTSPAVQSIYEYHDWPGVDCLQLDHLRNKPTHNMIHNFRELKSAANQFGKERALIEGISCAGWEATFEDMKRMTDWVMVNGANFINTGGSSYSIEGSRKYSYGCYYDWHSTWWDEYKKINEYQARLSYLLSRGRMEQRILVLNPTTTGYLDIEDPYCLDNLWIRSDWHDMKHPDMRQFLSVCQKLDDAQWDFDLGDEYTLARHAKVENGRIQVVKQQYDCVIISENMRNMLSSTVELLKQCMENEVEVIALGNPGCYVNGVRDEVVFAELAAKWTIVDAAELDTYLGSKFARKITSAVPFPQGVLHMCRKLEDGSELWFLVNHSMDTFEAELTIAGSDVEQLELYSGQVVEYPHKTEEGMLKLPVRLVRNQSLMLHVTGQTISREAGEEECRESMLCQDCQASLTKQTYEPELLGIVPEEENVYPIQYADYEDKKDTFVQLLRDRIFRERGFGSNPWTTTLQYRTNIIDRNAEYDEHSGFTAVYFFELEEGFAPERIALAAEKPHLCHLRVNGQDVDWQPGEWYLEYNIGVTDIAAYVTSGLNKVEVILDVFDVTYELDAVYIKGDFSVQTRNGKWVLCKPQSLTYGSWQEQGMPFYPGAVIYQYTLELENVPKKVLMDLKKYGASAVSMTVNGGEMVLLHADGKRPEDITKYLNPGTNQIEMRVCGNHRNLFGPHFYETNGAVWPHMWSANPEHSPKAEEYPLQNMGLMEAPVVIAE